MKTRNTTTGAGDSAALYIALSKLATWDNHNGPCFCQACEHQFGPQRHQHSAECETAREAMAIETGQHNNFIKRKLAWDYSLPLRGL